jgi:rubrerythrin
MITTISPSQNDPTTKITTFILKSRSDVTEFLSTRPDADQTIHWTCPKCHVKNDETFTSREAQCPVCGKFSFPKLHLPITGDERTTVRIAFMGNTLASMKDDVEEAKSEIQGLENKIDDLEEYVRTREKQIEDLKKAIYDEQLKEGDV